MRYFSSVAALLLALTVAAAAPLGETPLNDKYLPDDAEGVAVLNVKQILGSEMYAKHYEKLVDDFLTSGPAAPIMKDLGVDPLKDVDRLTIILTRSSISSAATATTEGPVVLLAGRFDAAKLGAAADKAAKDHPTQFKVHAHGIVEFNPSLGLNGFAVVLDKNHIIASPRRADIEAALDKVVGKKKTALASKPFAALFAKLKEGDSLGVAATGDAPGGKSVTQSGTNPPVVKVHTLSESGGAQAVLISVKIDSEAAITAALTTKDKDAAAQLDKRMEEGRKRAVENMEKSKEFAALAKTFKAVKTSVKGEIVTVEVKADAEALQQLVLAYFNLRPIGPPPAAEVKPAVDE